MQPSKNFIVVDTEGKNELREIAVIDCNGKLEYEAFSEEYPDNYRITLNKKPLKEILGDFNNLANHRVVIFHNAKHDLQVLKKSYKKVGIKANKLKYICTYQLAQKFLPKSTSYSLENLSKQLNIKVRNKYFNSSMAHHARYDAEFTYQLYCKIMTPITTIPQSQKANPFNSNRVDNPFQHHLDLSSIYQEQFQTLILAVNDIKSDHNNQSKGVVVTGEPGMGKTHLMMRLAKAKVEQFFTKSELQDILECNSIRSILNRAADYYRHKVNKIALPKKIKDETETKIIKLDDSSLSQRLEEIEKQLVSYKEIFTKISEVISEFNPSNNGKNPPIIPPIFPPPPIDPIKKYIEETTQILLNEYQKPKIITDHDDVGKLRKIVEAFKTEYSLEIDHLLLGKNKLPEHLIIKNEKQTVCIGFLEIGSSAFTFRIKNHNELVINNKNITFRLLRDCRQDKISGKSGKDEIAKLNYTKHGKFIIMDKENRINFELLYSLLVAIENKDLDVSWENLIQVISEELKDYWLVKILTGTAIK